MSLLIPFKDLIQDRFLLLLKRIIKNNKNGKKSYLLLK
jgi:hypothetical protein